MLAEILVGTLLFNSSKPSKSKSGKAYKAGKKAGKRKAKSDKMKRKREVMARREKYQAQLRKDRRKMLDAWSDFQNMK